MRLGNGRIKKPDEEAERGTRWCIPYKCEDVEMNWCICASFYYADLKITRVENSKSYGLRI